MILQHNKIIGSNGTTTFLLESSAETIDFQTVASTPSQTEALRAKCKQMVIKMTDSKTPIEKETIAEFFNTQAKGDKDGLLMTLILSAIFNRLNSPMTDFQFSIVEKMVGEVEIFLDGFKSQILDKFFLEQSIDQLEKEMLS